MKLKVKCVICQNIETKQPEEIDQEMGPICSLCCGPMTLVQASGQLKKNIQD